MISSSWTAHCVLCFFRLKIPSLKMTPRSWKILLSDSYRWFLCPYFQRCDKSKHKPWLLSSLISFVCTDFIRTWNMGVLNIWLFFFLAYHTNIPVMESRPEHSILFSYKGNCNSETLSHSFVHAFIWQVFFECLPFTGHCREHYNLLGNQICDTELEFRLPKS